MALAILDDDTLEHPPIEAVFTVDEELGMEGAEAIDLSVLKGKKLINLDSEEEKTLTVGCAGGVRYQGLIPVEKETASGEVIKITIQGLLGGHSGEEIHRQRGAHPVPAGAPRRPQLVHHRVRGIRNTNGINNLQVCKMLTETFWYHSGSYR